VVDGGALVTGARGLASAAERAAGGEEKWSDAHDARRTSNPRAWRKLARRVRAVVAEAIRCWLAPTGQGVMVTA
jgi:hypothetical protein